MFTLKSLPLQLVFILLFISGLCIAQKAKPKNDLEKNSYKGKVKAVNEIDKDGMNNKDYFYKHEIKYDERGNTSEMVRLTSGNVVVFKVLYIYNYSGTLTQEKRYKADRNGVFSLEYKYDYLYNDKDRLTEEKHYIPGENGLESLYELFTYTLDESGNVKELKIVDGDLKQIKRTTIQYDGRGNRIAMQTYNNDNIIMHSQTSKFDNKGNETEYTEFDETGKQVGKYLKVYDANNNQIQWSSVGANDTLLARNNFVYNTQGLLIETNSFSASNNPELRKSFSYTMDSHGNWTKKMFYKNGKLTEVMEREIQYY